MISFSLAVKGHRSSLQNLSVSSWIVFSAFFMTSSVIIAIGFLFADSFVVFAADLADDDFGVFGFFLALFDDFFAHRFVHRRNIDADDVSIRRWAEDLNWLFQSFSNSTGCLRIKGSNENLARLWSRDVGELFDAHVRAVDFDGNAVEHAGIGAISAEVFKFCFKVSRVACIFDFV